MFVPEVQYDFTFTQFHDRYLPLDLNSNRVHRVSEYSVSKNFVDQFSESDAAGEMLGDVCCFTIVQNSELEKKTEVDRQGKSPKVVQATRGRNDGVL